MLPFYEEKIKMFFYFFYRKKCLVLLFWSPEVTLFLYNNIPSQQSRVFDSYHCIKLHAKSLEAA